MCFYAGNPPLISARKIWRLLPELGSEQQNRCRNLRETQRTEKKAFRARADSPQSARQGGTEPGTTRFRDGRKTTQGPLKKMKCQWIGTHHKSRIPTRYKRSLTTCGIARSAPPFPPSLYHVSTTQATTTPGASDASLGRGNYEFPHGPLELSCKRIDI